MCGLLFSVAFSILPFWRVPVKSLAFKNDAKHFPSGSGGHTPSNSSIIQIYSNFVCKE